jgi:hypothetical protein
MTIRHLMIAVALIGGALGALRLASNAFTYNIGPDESLLMVGRSVLTFSEGGTEVRTFGNDGAYALPPYSFPPATSVPSGTRCVVVGEPAGDSDDCDPGRPVTIKVVEGPRKGDVLYIARKHLRTW